MSHVIALCTLCIYTPSAASRRANIHSGQGTPVIHLFMGAARYAHLAKAVHFQRYRGQQLYQLVAFFFERRPLTPHGGHHISITDFIVNSA